MLFSRPSIHHHGPGVRQDYVPVLVEPAREARDETCVRSGLRFAESRNQALCVQCVVNENRVEELDVGPAEVCDGVLADVRNTEAKDHGDGQARVDELTCKRGLRRIVIVEVHLIGVHRQERKPGVVSRSDRSAQWVLIDIAHRKILEVSAVRANW